MELEEEQRVDGGSRSTFEREMRRSGFGRMQVAVVILVDRSLNRSSCAAQLGL